MAPYQDGSDDKVIVMRHTDIADHTIEGYKSRAQLEMSTASPQPGAAPPALARLQDLPAAR